MSENGKYRTCTVCKRDFPATEKHFYKRSGCKLGLAAKCKQCHGDENRKWRRNNKAIVNKINRRRIKKERNKVRKPDVSLVCEIGQVVIHNGRLVYVTEVLRNGHAGGIEDVVFAERRKAYISGCLYDQRTETPLYRTSIHAGEDWEHLKSS
jgi:hypothetical protein